jgi:hypothetical protein
MKTTILISILMCASAGAQKLTALEPVRISIASDAEATPLDRQFNDLLQTELSRAGRVAFTQAKMDVKVLTATTAISEQGRRTGYAASVATLSQGRDGFSLRLHIATAPTLDELAHEAARWLDKELRTLRRKK